MPAIARILVPAGGDSDLAVTITGGRQDRDSSTRIFPCKEWSIIDDVLNIADSASVGIANSRGENADKFTIGQLVYFDLSDPSVAGGRWIRQFTGRITSKRSYTDADGGSNIALGMMDLGWHLTSSHGEPLKNIKGIRFQKLLEILLDDSWRIGPVQFDGDRNTRLKHGRQVIIQNLRPVLGAVLPYIQVEPGQTPFDIIRVYAQREGLLINIGARGELIFFRPNYNAQPVYSFQIHPTTDPRSGFNNMEDQPTLEETIDGMYTETQCWSTVVIPPEVANTENPNEMYRHTTYRPDQRPLPFERRHVFSDGEAINTTLRRNRAIAKYQMGLFQSWQYNFSAKDHSQGGGFFVSNTLASIEDSINGLSGSYYVQQVQKSYTLGGGSKTRFLVRKTGLLNPELTALDLGGGARKAARVKEPRE